MLIPWSAGSAKIATSLKRSFNCLLDDSNTKLLIHSNTTDGSTTFTDSSASSHVITAVNDVQHDTAQYKFGTSSILFDGTGDELTTPIDSDFDFGTSNFTIDWWVRFASIAAAATFFSITEDAQNHFSVYWSPNYIRFYARNGAVTMCDYTFTWTPTINTWYHIAVVRNTTTLYCFLDGISQTLSETTAISTNDIGVDDGGSTDKVYIGGSSLGDLNGWLDEFRITKGKARWIHSFPPPWKAY